MAQYCDPIAYNFSFKAITANDVEPELKAAFRDLVMPFLDCILEYGGFGGPPCKGLTPAPLEHPYTTTFPTYRAGFLPEEIDFDGKLKPWSDFAVRHEDGEAF